MGLKRKNILILATIQKTGTHYIRFLLSYYILLKNTKEKGKNINEVQPDDFIIDKYFPNSWHTSYMFVKKRNLPTKLLKEINLVDIPRSHLALKIIEWSGIKVLHTYRDLLDQTIVEWETKYQCNSLLKNQFNNPWELYLSTKENIINQKLSFQNSSIKNINYLRIEFSQIFTNPFNTLALIVSWLGKEPDLDICKKAVELAKKTPSVLIGGGEKWHRDNSENIDYAYLNDFIKKNVNNGAIGISKKYFNAKQINKANKEIYLSG
jgi:hypothetical protein